ncbi:peptidoglycan-binding protein [Anaerosporobacter sp.]|uniref:peptidoglycan-binding protein n=1 Tax=Anaerosporobacter sp. TaxID=1872529 RepID=UPI00286EECF9|nr:peptidoglycan-binding protein [Anaerosporobacter sp.]
MRKNITLKIKKAVLALTVAVTVTNFTYIPAAASPIQSHSGRTDSSGGHKDNKNKSGLGSYHYHCGGHEAHLHKNGVCPYSSSSTTSNSSTSTTKKTTTTTTSSSTIKKVQTALNKLGYDCGTPDGICGKKTKNAIKKYKQDKGLTVNTKIDSKLKKSLGIK